MKDYKLKFETLSEIKNNICKQTDPIIDDGILIEQGMLLIAAQQKKGKSMLVNNLALALSQGKSFCGFKVPRARKTILLSAEGGEQENGKRIAKMTQIFGDEFDESMLGICRDARILISDDDGFSTLLKILEEVKPEVIILDPLSKFHQYEENSSKEMTELMRRIRFMMDKLNAASIITHHLGKDEWKGARGSSVIMAEYDSFIRLRGNLKTKVQCAFELRHNASPDPRSFYLNSETLWFNEKNIRAASIFHNIINSHGAMTQSDLVKKAVEAGINPHKTNVYRDIKKELDQGILIIDGGLLKLNSIS